MGSVLDPLAAASNGELNDFGSGALLSRGRLPLWLASPA